MAEKDALSTKLDAWEKEMIRDNRVIHVLNEYKKQAYDEIDGDPARKGGPVKREYLQESIENSRMYAGMVRGGTEAAIRSSEELQSKYLGEIKADRLTGLELAPLKMRVEGAYDPNEALLYINPQTAMAARQYDKGQEKFAPQFRELVGTLGHEGDHSKDREGLIKETRAFGLKAEAVLNNGKPVHDFTGVVRGYVSMRGSSEARAHLEYYNSIVRSIDGDLTEAKIRDSIPPERRADFFDPRTGALRAGLTPEASGSHLLPQTEKNTEALRETYFNRKQFGANDSESYASRETGRVIAGILNADTNAQKTVVNLKALGIDYNTIQPHLAAQAPNRTFYDNSSGQMVKLETNKPLETPARSAPTHHATPPPDAAPRRPALEDGDAEQAHPLYAQAMQHLRDLGPQAAGYANAEELQRMAGSLAEAAQQRNLRSIESVVPSTDGKGLIATWSNPGNPLDNDRVYMDKTAGANQPIEQSLQRLSASAPEREQRQELAAPQQNVPQIQGFLR